jgi:hypothetical protein
MKLRWMVAFPLVAGGLVWALPSRTRADEPQPTQGLSCVVSAVTQVQPSSAVYDRGSGGTAIAQLTGVATPVTITHIPNPPQGRVRIGTSKGSGAFRIDGWTAIETFRFFAAADLPVVSGGHVWITRGQELTLSAARANGFTVDHHVLGTADQTVSAAIGCDDVTLELLQIDFADPPSNARYYDMTSSTIDLYDAAGGSVVFTLKLEEGTRKTFWSTESRAGFVHVVARSDITIDAWVRSRDVSWTKHAEVFDMANLAPKPWKERKLALEGSPKAVAVSSDLPIHSRPENMPSPIGWVESGAKVYAMETRGDWTNVLPESLTVMPPDKSGFWVRTTGLPKQSSDGSTGP